MLNPCRITFDRFLDESVSSYVDATTANDELFLVELMAARAPESCDHADCPYRGASCWPTVAKVELKPESTSTADSSPEL